MKVRATRNGYYGHYRLAGDEFEIDADAFADAKDENGWMEAVLSNGADAAAPAQSDPPVDAPAEQEAAPQAEVQT